MQAPKPCFIALRRIHFDDFLVPVGMLQHHAGPLHADQAGASNLAAFAHPLPVDDCTDLTAQAHPTKPLGLFRPFSPAPA